MGKLNTITDWLGWARLREGVKKKLLDNRDFSQMIQEDLGNSRVLKNQFKGDTSNNRSMT